MRGFIYLAHVLFFCRCLIKFIVLFKTVCVLIKNNKHEITDQYPQVVPQVGNDHTIIHTSNESDGWFILILSMIYPHFIHGLSSFARAIVLTWTVQITRSINIR